MTTLLPDGLLLQGLQRRGLIELSRLEGQRCFILCISGTICQPPFIIIIIIIIVKQWRIRKGARLCFLDYSL